MLGAPQKAAEIFRRFFYDASASQTNFNQ